jgi:phenylalanyl-tRNA synthetase beta chain
MFDQTSQTECYEGELVAEKEREERKILVDADEVASIVGMRIEMSKIATYLKKLGFGVTAMNDKQLACTVPLFRHDIKNIQDVTEEIVRMVGINNIPDIPLTFEEKNRQNETYRRFKAKSALRQRAVSAGFYEAVTYVFSDSKLLKKYGFAVQEGDKALANPIVEELDTLRSTMLINLLQAVKRNVNYNKRAVALFETGAVFDAERRQYEKVAFVFAGQKEPEGVINSGKPAAIDFEHFVMRLGGVIGPFTLAPCTEKNGLIHPYQSADIVINDKRVGYVSKLHLSVQEDFDIPTTYIAEIDFDAIMPQHKNADTISNYQGTFKDLSVVVDRALPYGEVKAAIEALQEPLLKRYYPIDIYHDDTLGDKHSLTMRFFIQSDEKTLEDGDIEAVMSRILATLEEKFGAKLR